MYDDTILYDATRMYDDTKSIDQTYETKMKDVAKSLTVRKDQTLQSELTIQDFPTKRIANNFEKSNTSSDVIQLNLSHHNPKETELTSFLFFSSPSSNHPNAFLSNQLLTQSANLDTLSHTH